MKNILLFSLILIALLGCTKVGEPPMHPSGWTDENSEDSHMAKIAVTGIENCKECHGGVEKNDYFGGTSGVGCDDCHEGPSGHPNFNVWVGNPDHEDFHGNDNISRCSACHGEDYTGGLAGVNCYTCHVDNE